MVSNLERFSVVIDSNEYHVGHTWIFPGYNHSVRSLLDYGCDYSVKGQVGYIGVERKSYSDYCRCLGMDWKRFQKQLEKLRKNKHHVLVVEGHIDDQIDQRSLMVHDVVVAQTARIIAEHRVPIVFTGSRHKAVAFCLKFMQIALRRIQDGD